MDTSKILYKGLVGSRLYQCERTESDTDYFVILTEVTPGPHRFETPEGIIDYYQAAPYDFMHTLFDDHPLTFWQVNVLEKLFSKNTKEFTSPLEEWLCANRLMIMNTNRSYFGATLLWRAQIIASSEMNIYTHPPKIMAKSLMNLYTYINFASIDDYTFGSFTEKQSQLLKDIRENKFTNIEVFNLLQTTLDEAKEYQNFWNIPKDIDEQQRLKNEMEAIISALIGEELNLCQS